MQTTYTVKSKNSNNVWVFKYCLNNTLQEFKVLEGELSPVQLNWFFTKGNFPYKEEQIQEWQKKLKANFEIMVGGADLSFEALWTLYNHKVKRVEAEKSYTKLKEADIIKCFIQVPWYKKYLQRTKIAQAHLSTFINQRYFEDDYKKL